MTGEPREEEPYWYTYWNTECVRVGITVYNSASYLGGIFDTSGWDDAGDYYPPFYEWVEVNVIKGSENWKDAITAFIETAAADLGIA